LTHRFSSAQCSYSRTRLSAKCHRHLADTPYSSATAGSEVSNCEVIEAELLLTLKCVCTTALGVRVDWIFWICVLGKTRFPSYVGLKTVIWSIWCRE